ncbi:MAG: hypothetical protein HPY65_11120 [Syntrophaceae bacterium]|nr:hypothetical protein [Syntrophaceae bacterium]
MKKAEWNEGSAARKVAAGRKEEELKLKVVRKAGAKTAARTGQVNFTAEVLQDAIKGIINNQVP